MAMDFPNSPTVNQTYTVGDKTWKWSGTAWEIVVNRPAMRTVADTPPASPIVGDEWFNSLTGRTYTWFDSYWVEVNTNSVVGASGLNGVASASAPLVYTSGSNNISVQSAPTFTDGITTNAGADGQVLKLKARSSDNFNQIAWYNSAGSNFTGLWQVNSDASVNIVRNTTPGGTSQNFQNSISINPGGNVAMPFQPAILVDGNYSAWTTVGSGNNLTGTYFALSYSRGGISWDGATGKITVPVAGYYKFTLVIYHAGNTGTRHYLNKNGNAVGFTQVSTASITDGQSMQSWITTAAANDYYQIYVQTAGNAYYGSQHSYMIMEYLG